MSDTVTRGIRVLVRPRYIEEQSDPENERWLFAYHVTIRNEGDRTVQLLSRHWIITNGQGQTEDVRGPGVVGHQPILAPGEQFEYTSACPLETPVGTMHGSFQMAVIGSTERFDAAIRPFRPAVPPLLN